MWRACNRLRSLHIKISVTIWFVTTCAVFCRGYMLIQTLTSLAIHSHRARQQETYHDSIAGGVVPGNNRFLYEHISKNAFFESRKESCKAAGETKRQLRVRSVPPQWRSVEPSKVNPSDVGTNIHVDEAQQRPWSLQNAVPKFHPREAQLKPQPAINSAKIFFIGWPSKDRKPCKMELPNFIRSRSKPEIWQSAEFCHWPNKNHEPHKMELQKSIRAFLWGLCTEITILAWSSVWETQKEFDSQCACTEPSNYSFWISCFVLHLTPCHTCILLSTACIASNVLHLSSCSLRLSCTLHLLVPCPRILHLVAPRLASLSCPCALRRLLFAFHLCLSSFRFCLLRVCFLFFCLRCITLHYATLQYSTVQYSPLHYMTLHYIPFHCIALHCITLHYIALHCVALHYITLRYITLHYLTLPYLTLHYITLHLHYITLPCLALPCLTLPYLTLPYVTFTLRYITLHNITLRYVTLHYVAFRYVTLRYITLHYIRLD